MDCASKLLGGKTLKTQNTKELLYDLQVLIVNNTNAKANNQAEGIHERIRKINMIKQEIISRTGGKQ